MQRCYWWSCLIPDVHPISRLAMMPHRNGSFLIIISIDTKIVSSHDSNGRNFTFFRNKSNYVLILGFLLLLTWTMSLLMAQINKPIEFLAFVFFMTEALIFSTVLDEIPSFIPISREVFCLRINFRIWFSLLVRLSFIFIYLYSFTCYCVKIPNLNQWLIWLLSIIKKISIYNTWFWVNAFLI